MKGIVRVNSLSVNTNTTDDSILSLIDLSNEDVMNENSNKNPIWLLLKEI